MASFGRKCATGLSILGLVLIIMAVIISSVILKKLSDGIADKVAIKTSTADAAAYKKWSDTTDPAAPAKYWKVYFYNLTNPASFALTGAPQFEEVGPYVFREYDIKFNVSFSEGDSKVTFNDQTFYVFDQAQSGSLLATDQITSLWTTYFGAVLRAGGSETKFAAGATQLYLQFALKVYSQLQYAVYPNQTKEANAYNTAAQWATLSGDDRLGVPANTSFVSSPKVQAMLNQVSPQALQILTAMASFNVYPEFGVALNKTNADRPAVMTALRDLFGNTTPQSCPLTNVTVIGGSPIPCTVYFLQSLAAQPNATLAAYGLTETQGFLLAQYLKSSTDVFLKVVAKGAGAKDPNNKLWVTRTPAQWLYSYNDPLLSLAGASSTNSGLFPTNYSSANAAYADKPGSTTLYTGKSDYTLAQRYISWNSLTVLPARNGSTGYWCGHNEPVGGHSDIQFQPGSASAFRFHDGVKKSDHPKVWVDSVFRQVAFDYVQDVDVKGISALEFRIAQSEFTVMPEYSQYYPGLLNLSCPKGAPVVLTLPHYLRVDASASYLLANITAGVSQQHETYVQIDPITGATLRGYQRLQVNMLSPGGLVTSNPLLYPILWVEKSAQLTDQQASDYKGKIIHAFNIRKGVVISFSVIGSLLIVGSVVWICYERRKSADQQLAQSNDGATYYRMDQQ